MYNSKQNHLTYRADIDGLRAIAILFVVLFHAFPALLPGGFIGVDIFFVISGFLISSIVFANLENANFSFADFYLRRVKRLFPALIIVLIACIIFGWFSLLADEYQRLGKHVAGAAVFIDNFFFWHESGYFDLSAEAKPLLHLWSLGVEGQFYCIWPLLLWGFHKNKINLLVITIIIMTLSFVWDILNFMQNPSATFYLPQARIWELLCGAVAAWHNIYGKVRFANNTRNIMTIVGLLLVMFSAYYITKQSYFPGYWAVLPTLGATLVIMAGRQAKLNHVFLAHPVLVWIGLISYPLYLWHWPLLSFARILENDILSVSMRISLIIISILLAWLTYQFIEKPIAKAKNNKLCAQFLVLIMVVAGGVGYAVYQQKGVPFRKAIEDTLVNNHLLIWNDYKSKNCIKKLGANPTFCKQWGNTDNLRLAIIGDSTGNSLAPSLGAVYAARGLGVINVGSFTCPPIRGLLPTAKWGKNNDNCLQAVDKAYKLILSSKTIDTVVLAIFARDLQHWGIPDVNYGASPETRFARLKRLLDKDIAVLQHSGKKVIVTYDVPYNPVSARQCIPRPLTHKISSKCDVSEAQLVDRQPYLKLFDDYFIHKPSICIVRQSNVLLKNGKTKFVDDNGKLILRDTHHLSVYGSSLMAKEFYQSGCLAF